MFITRVKDKADKDSAGQTEIIGGSFFRAILFLLILLASVAILSFHYFSEAEVPKPEIRENNETDIKTERPKVLPWIFAVTPTYQRKTQKADLVRLSQTLQHVKKLKWIVVEDANQRSKKLSQFLRESEVKYVHLNVKSPRKAKHKAVLQRNIAILWIRRNVDPRETPGVVYFMDDDNTYHRKIFEIMRRTRRVGAWRVGFAGGVMAEGPVVRGNKIVNFHTNFAPKRAVPLDMAAFAVNIQHLMDTNAQFRFKPRAGYLESDFLSQMTTREQLEPLAGNMVYVWHTQTRVPHISRQNPTEKWIEV